MTTFYTLDFGQNGIRDITRVGGKNTSLGQLFNALKPRGVGVLDGFATTAEAYRRLLAEGDLGNKLREIFSNFNPENVDQLSQRGHAARVAALETPLPAKLRDAILEAYDRLCERSGKSRYRRPIQKRQV
jgi:pyruvate,water dikinase